MPTFYFSDDEIRKIVLFFQAMSSQPDAVYSPEREASRSHGNGDGSQPVHKPCRSVPEMPYDRQP